MEGQVGREDRQVGREVGRSEAQVHVIKATHYDQRGKNKERRKGRR